MSATIDLARLLGECRRQNLSFADLESEIRVPVGSLAAAPSGDASSQLELVSAVAAALGVEPLDITR